MDKALTEKQQKVIDKLTQLSKEKQGPVTPTEVGMAMGFTYDTASSKCMAGIKKALELGLIEKVGRGQYQYISKT